MTNVKLSEKEILEGSKLIAEFMGYKFAGDGKNMHYNVTKPGENHWYYGSWPIDGLNEHLIEEFDYHLSWDLLMPVVEKISRIEFERRFDGEKWVVWTHHPITFGMLNEQGRPMVRFYCGGLYDGDTLIEATWLAVVGFIETHNNPLIPGINEPL
jgi:hypothetical protein